MHSVLPRLMILLSLGFFLAPLSCKKEEAPWDLEVPSTPILTGTVGWGVVNTAYLKINKEPDDDQFVVTTLREGDIVRIESVHYLKGARGKNVTVWYEIKWDDLTGWVKDTYLDPYDTKEKAETGSGMLLNASPAE